MKRLHHSYPMTQNSFWNENTFSHIARVAKQSTLNPIMFVSRGGMRLPVWDGQASIHSPLQSTKHLVACGGSSKPSIQVAGESAWLTINALHVKLVACHLHLAFVHLIQAKLVQQLRTENWKIWDSKFDIWFSSQILLFKFPLAYLRTPHFLCGQSFDLTMTQFQLRMQLGKVKTKDIHHQLWISSPSGH